MHARDCAGQDNGASCPFPPRRGPGRTEDEEKSQSDDARSDCNERCADNVDRVVNANIVVDGVVAKIMHSADSSAGEDATDCNSPPRYSVVDADGDKRSEKHGDGDEEGQGREAARICDL